MGVFDRIKKNGKRIFRKRKSEETKDSRDRILFVSHEATRTGAPLIALNLLKQFTLETDYAYETILHNSGILYNDFSAFSKTKCLNLPRKETPQLIRRVQRIVERKSARKPLLAVCNSMESRHVANELHKAGIPILFLVHELPSSYLDSDYEHLNQISDHLVFPANVVKNQTHEIFEFPEDKTSVIPQGLLDPDFGKRIVREHARQMIRAELGLPEDSQIVLSCGTLDLRKGIDHFTAIARETLRRQKIKNHKTTTHFIWVGGGPQWTHSPFHYVQLDVDKSEIRSSVHFVGEQDDVEPYFVGADVFLLPSRVDPFPCVIHEAMAARLPIIAFDQSGGASEAIQEESGIILPYADYGAVADTIMLLASQPHLTEVLGERSFERVQSEFRFVDYADRIMRLAEQVSSASFSRQPRYLPFAA